MWRRRTKLQHIDTTMLNIFLMWWILQVKSEIRKLPINVKYLVLSKYQLKGYNREVGYSHFN